MGCRHRERAGGRETEKNGARERIRDKEQTAVESELFREPTTRLLSGP